MSKIKAFAEKKHSKLEFYSWGLQRTVVKKFVQLRSSPPSPFFFVGIKRLLSLRALQLAYVEKVHPPLLDNDDGVVIVGLLILSYLSNC